MSQASEVELLMLELINEERTSRGLDPLTINNALNEASEDHSEWMLDTDTFSHTGVGGSSATERIVASDYALEGSWRTAENIGWQSERGEPGIADDVRSIHERLMESDGHRANILNPDLEDIGIGIETGDFNGYDAVMVTQNFGRTDAISDEPQQDQAPEPPVAVADEMPEPVPTQPPAPTVPEDDGPTPEKEPEVVDTTNEDDADDQPVPTTTDMASPDDDVFEFCDLEGDDSPDDQTTVTAFTGTVATGEGTFETDDQEEFAMMLADLFEAFGGFNCGFEMEFV